MADAKQIISHVLVGATSAFCIFNTSRAGGWHWIYGTYGTLCFYSLAGIWRHSGLSLRSGEYQIKVYDWSEKLVELFALPCTVTALYLQYNYQKEYALAHFIFPCIPLILKIIQDWEQELVDGIFLANVVSCLFIGGSNRNVEAIVMGIISLLAQFDLRKHSYFDVPNEIMYNTSLCIIVYLAYRSLFEITTF